jgi:hypothetical protein
MVARLENWAEGPQIPLSSSPFASEIPSPIVPPSAHPPKSDPISAALRDNLGVNAALLAKASQGKAARSSSVLWILCAILIAGIVGYVAHR